MTKEEIRAAWKTFKTEVAEEQNRLRANPYVTDEQFISIPGRVAAQIVEEKHCVTMTQLLDAIEEMNA